MTPVGIEKIGVYPCALALPMERLCAARGNDPRHLREGLLVDERSLNPAWEDPVTMAVHAAARVLTDEDRQKIALLLVCSESGVDQEKPMSTWVHRYLGLPAHCRNLELKHACYSGTGALHLAASWVRAGVEPGKKALVITTDQSRMHLGQPWEYVMGAGACALLVGDQPDFLELELGASGVYTEEVSDLTRPTSRVETGNSELSLISYLNALEETWDDFTRVVGDVNLDRDFRWNVYHVPFGGLTLRAHRALLRRGGLYDRDAVARHFAARTLPSLAYNRRMGGTYAGATFIALLGLVDHSEAQPGDPISIFSYGSGCCAELYRARLGRRVREVAASAALGRALDQRRVVEVAEYEAIERERTASVDEGNFAPGLETPGDLWAHAYEGKQRLVFRGMAEHVRRYGWS
jgi:3-hydroxy-3-methylglutaryl CoA synthase